MFGEQPAKVKECILPPYCCFGGNFVRSFLRAQQRVQELELPKEEMCLHAACGWLCSQTAVPRGESQGDIPATQPHSQPLITAGRPRAALTGAGRGGTCGAVANDAQLAKS